MAVVLIPVLLAFVGIGFVWSYRSSVQAELQSRVDAMAHDAATTLNSSLAGFAASQHAALLALNQENFSAKYLNGAELNFAPQASPRWQSGDLEVRIYRGRWWGNNNIPVGSLPGEQVTTLNQLAMFEPMEIGPDEVGFPAGGMTNAEWQLAHPGVPDAVVANAAYVRLELKNKSSISNFLGQLVPSLSLNFTITAVATAGDQGEMSIAPFAIPVCALTDATGSYDPAYQCQFDRYFTGVPAITRAIANKTLPGFHSSTLAGPAQMTTAHGACTEYMRGGRCTASGYGFAEDGFPDVPGAGVADQYGVIGLPETAIGGALALEETSIVNHISAGNGIPARIGDVFQILPNGFQSPDSDAAIWGMLNGTTSYPFASQRLSFEDSMNLGMLGLRGRLMDTPTPDPGTWFKKSIYEAGVCNSKIADFSRYSWQLWGLLPCYAAPEDTGTHYRPKVLRMNVPVIADMSSSGGCKSASVANDAVIDASKTYRIIGFVAVSLYDLDIGIPPPPPPTQLTVWRDGSTRDCIVNFKTYPDYSYGKTPWQYDPDRDGTPDNCNLLRARTNCDTSLVPTIQINSQRTPKIVN